MRRLQKLENKIFIVADKVDCGRCLNIGVKNYDYSTSLQLNTSSFFFRVPFYT